VVHETEFVSPSFLTNRSKPKLLFLQATVNGRGEQQQLYCPGTVDHSHKLTFKLDNGVLPSNPYVPLSYTLIDQRKFLKIDDKDIDIDAIVASLNGVKTPVWPFIGEEYANVAWVATEQPETHVQVSTHCMSM
jgi:vacuolar protein sorting-associated protein 13B